MPIFSRQGLLGDVGGGPSGLDPAMARDVQKIIVINRAIVNERYCPAKKPFLAASNATEFAKRETNHCKNSAPTGLRLIRAEEVNLTAECQQVHATTCP